MLSTFDPHRRVNGTDLFLGEFTKVDIKDPERPGRVPNLVIDPSKPFTIDIEWQLTGDDVHLYLDGPSTRGDSWSVEAFAESMGPGPEIQISSNTVPVGPVVEPKTYSTTLTISPNTLPEGNPGNGNPSGVYKLVCTAFLNSNRGGGGFDICGFAEGPVFKVENPL